MSPPDWVHCVRKEDPYNPADNGKVTWCGRRAPMEWLFVNVQHAIATAIREDRQQVCPRCTNAIGKTLATQTWDGEPDPEP